MKELIAGFLQAAGINAIFFHLTKILYGRHIRVVNFHGTPLAHVENFEKQIQFLSRRYQNVDYKELCRYFSGDRSFLQKPGLIISFDDGHRSNFVNALPVLEKYGFTAWLMIPPGPVDYDLKEQEKFVGEFAADDLAQFVDGRLVMNWNELTEASEKHVIASHTFTHHRMNEKDDADCLEMEIAMSKRKLESKINKPVTIFCWVGGEERHYTRTAASKISESGYTFGFMTNTIPILSSTNPLQINRTNIEAWNSLPLVKFQLSGIMDLYYYPKYRRVNALTKEC